MGTHHSNIGWLSAPAHQITAPSHIYCSAAAAPPAIAVDQNTSGQTAIDQISACRHSPSQAHSAATETAPCATSHLLPSCSTSASPSSTQSSCCVRDQAGSSHTR